MYFANQIIHNIKKNKPYKINEKNSSFAWGKLPQPNTHYIFKNMFTQFIIGPTEQEGTSTITHYRHALFPNKNKPPKITKDQTAREIKIATIYTGGQLDELRTTYPKLPKNEIKATQWLLDHKIIIPATKETKAHKKAIEIEQKKRFIKELNEEIKRKQARLKEIKKTL